LVILVFVILDYLKSIMSEIEMDETTPQVSDEIDLNASLQQVLKSAARNDGLARGLRGKQNFPSNLSLICFCLRICQSIRSS